MSALTGGCQCGAVRYSISGGPYPVYACHCRECQRQSASGFGLSMPVPLERLVITGELAFWERATDSGRRTRCAFCPACGTRVYHQPAGSLTTFTVKAGTLDDISTIRPVAHLWISRKQPWVVLDENIPCFDTQPSNLRTWRDALLERRN